ncbi:hypothetical protein ACFVTY_18340 [Streptomyces sp. NPDC058067]|uniref:hypothetical protein n=1 Tax=Streptomyces sp. NPDC058067 TaxID=3346324 RepID=UPI0036ECACD2
MAGRRRGAGGARSCAVLLCLSGLLAGLVGCGGGSAQDTARADVQRTLDRRAHAVLAGDAAAYRDTGSAQAAVPADLADVPLASWTYRLTRLDRSGGRATADADLDYRISGYDSAPVVSSRTLKLELRGAHWYVTSDRPAPKAGQQLWEQGRVVVERGAHSLVLGVGRPRSALRQYADLADEAVPAVQDAWGSGWARRVVVLVPKSLDGMGGLLGAPAAGYRGIAAVTTGEAGSGGRTPADRIIVNPDAYGALGSFGKQVVLTHETAHVATRSATSQATPLWLSEGYADWAGYRGTGRSAVQAAPELERAVRLGRLPAALPTDADFGFSGDAGRLAQAYEGGWLACRMIADRWGEAKLNAFYRAVGKHKERAGAVAKALQSVLGTTEEKFTADWRDYLRAQLG